MTDDQPTAAPEPHDDQLSPTDGVTVRPARPAPLTYPHGADGDPDIPNSGGQQEEHYADGTQLLAELDPPDIDPDVVAALQHGQRRLLAEPSANLDRDDRPHFQRVVEGQEPLCGQCGQPFPCPAYLQITEDQPGQVRNVFDLPAIRGQGNTLTVEQAADMFNLPVDLVRERLAQQQRR